MKLVQVAFLQEVRFGGEYLRVVRNGQSGLVVSTVHGIDGRPRIYVGRGSAHVTVPLSNCCLEYEDEVSNIERTAAAFAKLPPAPDENVIITGLTPEHAPKKRKKEPTP